MDIYLTITNAQQHFEKKEKEFLGDTRAIIALNWYKSEQVDFA
jgi:hypothetical protein